MSSKLKQITAHAKKLYKTGKFSKWTDAIKEASKKISGTKKTGKSYHKDTKSHNVRISVVSGRKIGAAGDYAKFEIATIKALSKLLKKSIKSTQILVNNDQNILNIISNSFDKKLTPLQTAKIIKAEIVPAPKKDPLNAFVKLLSKPSAKQKGNFPMKLPATVTIGTVSGVGKERMLRTWTDVYGRLASEYIRANPKQKKVIAKEMKIAREIIQNLKRSK